MQNGTLRLCALGTRALIEQIMVAKVGDAGTLGDNIEAFLNAGYVAQQDHKIFREKVVELGNAAMHRGYTPASGDLHTLLDIIEALIASIYVHPHRAASMGKEIASPPPKKEVRDTFIRAHPLRDAVAHRTYATEKSEFFEA